MKLLILIILMLVSDSISQVNLALASAPGTEYTNLMLVTLGLMGMVMHAMVKVYKINKANGGNFNALAFFKMEWPSLVSSLTLVFMCVIAKREITKLDQVGEYLGFGFAFIGFGGQSLFYSLFGRAEKKIKQLSGSDEPNESKPTDEKN